MNRSVPKACLTSFDHCHYLFRGELSKNQVILQNIHLRMDISGDLFGVFDKTDAQWWNKSHMYYCYITMQSTCCQGDKSLAPESQTVIGDWSAYPQISMDMLLCRGHVQINSQTMDQLVNVLLAIDKAHITTEGLGLQIRLRWVKPGWAQPSHSLSLEYVWQIWQHLYEMYN